MISGCASAFDLDSSFIFKSRISSRTDLVRRPCDMSLSNAKVSSSLGYQVGDLGEGITMLKAQSCLSGLREQNPLIPYGRQQISEDDIDRVNAALRSAWLTQGPMGQVRAVRGEGGRRGIRSGYKQRD